MLCLVLAGLDTPHLVAQESDSNLDPAQLDFFETKIRPVLVKHCYECHAADSEEVGGNLLLDSKEGMVTGGDLGKSFVTGNPEKSLIISALKHDELEMPPDGKLDDSIVRDFEQWIRNGAVDPRLNGKSISRKSIDIEEGRKFWSFQPVHPPMLETKSKDSSIDQIVSRKIMQELDRPKQSLFPSAKPLDLLERVHFDLTGLPPSPKDQAEFASGKISFEQVVERLLNSKHFGERFGRHWLDVARYADSSGGGRILMFSDAWRYRDYVVRSFNDDKPFDVFVKEQIAGDLMPSKSMDHKADQLTGLGFLMLGAHNFELQDKELLRMEVVDEQINVFGRAFLGLTLSCARCHDHKFDPIPTTDYYALAGIFRSTKSLLPGNVSQFVTTDLPLELAEQKKLDAFNKLKSDAQANVAAIKKKIDSIKKGVTSFDAQNLKSFDGQIIDDEDAVKNGEWTHSTSVSPYIHKGYHHSLDPAATMTFNFKVKNSGQFILRAAYTASSNRTVDGNYVVTINGEQKKNVEVNQRKQPPIENHFAKLMDVILKNGDTVQVILKTGTGGTTIADAIQLLPVGGKFSSDAELAKVKKKKQLKQLQNELAQANTTLAQYKSPPAKIEKVMSVRDEAKTEDFFVCIRGDVHSLGNKVQRSALQVIGNLDAFKDLKQSGRLELAHWIANKNNPLPARVYANRIWYWLFGKGIVDTPDNFGAMGQRPSNPELLDYLATRLVEQNWSTKAIVKEIVMSKVYRQRAAGKTEFDTDNRWFARHPRKRLDAESIRDRILSFSGQLDKGFGGPSIKPGTKKEFGYKYDSLKRSVYLPVFRNTMNELFEVFDFPNPNLVSGKRNTSVLPTQALFLMNSPFVAKQSQHAATRIIEFAPDRFEEQLDFAYQISVSRNATPAEVAVAKKFFGPLSSAPNADKEALQAAWTQYCQILISSIDFRYLK